MKNIILVITSILAISLFSNIAQSAEHTVKMKNSGKDGIMIFEPAVVKVEVGDTVTFVPTDMSHNSELVKGLSPEGSVSWKGAMNEKVSVTIDKEGVYIYQCAPHAMMAMVGVIVAGKPTNLDVITKDAEKFADSTFSMNKDRLKKYLSEVK